MTPIERSDALHERVQAAIAGSPVDQPWSDEQFGDLARDLFAWQAERCPLFARFAAGRGAQDPASVAWDSIPPVPTDVWKAVDLWAFPELPPRATFLTSGTTVGARGRHHLRRVDTYEASLAPGADRWLALGDRPQILVLGAPLAEDPASSLGHMLDWLLEHRGGPGSRHCWDAGPDLDAAEELLRAAERPVLLLGTARAVQALWQEKLQRPIPLPAGSRLMETGGFKGDRALMDRDDFYEAVAVGLGLPREGVISEYGMTELGSQGWQPGWAFRLEGRSAPPRTYRFPPWCRVRAMDPDTLEPRPDGQEGLLAFWDLANVDSVIGVQTADVGRVTPDGVELFGRAPGARPRGCSLAVDEILAAQAGG